MPGNLLSKFLKSFDFRLSLLVSV